MKFAGEDIGVLVLLSPPSRGAWIEMLIFASTATVGVKSPPSRGAWIEILSYSWNIFAVRPSPPSRGAWIEMPRRTPDDMACVVAPLAGGVD